MFPWKSIRREKSVYMTFNIIGSEIGTKAAQEVYNKADVP